MGGQTRVERNVGKEGAALDVSRAWSRRRWGVPIFELSTSRNCRFYHVNYGETNLGVDRGVDKDLPLPTAARGGEEKERIDRLVTPDPSELEIS